MKTVPLLAVAAVGVLLSLPGQTAEAFFFHKKSCCPPPPPIKVVLDVCHPCTGCVYHVPVCIPHCCCGAPCVSFKKTLFGHGKVVYTWKCGHKVTIRFPKWGGYRVAKW